MVGAEEFLSHHRHLTRKIHDPLFLQQPRETKLMELAGFCARAIDVDKVTVWRMHHQSQCLSCECEHPASPNAGTDSLPVLEKRHYPDYFAVLTDTGYINAPDARNDPTLNEFSHERLTSLEFGSTLQVPVCGNQGLEGVVALSSRANGQTWCAHDVALAGAVAETISMINLREDWRASQQMLEYLALHDSVTALPNQNALINHLTLNTENSADHSTLVLLWLDIDRFKSVTESVGENGLNQVVSLIGARLQQSCIRPAEIAVRLAKDEFALVLDAEATEFEDLVMRIDGLHKRLANSYDVNGRQVDLTVSIGVARHTGQSVKTWLNEAESAMLEAKSMGGDRSVHFSETIKRERDRRLTLEIELRQAIDKEQLCLHYQPIFAAQTGQIVCAEALIRWDHPTRGLISPGEFLPLAARVGLMGQIDAYVLRRVCATLKLLRDQRRPCRIAVNLSGIQLCDNLFPEFVRSTLHDYKLDGDLLEIEVTEHATKGDPFAVATNLQRLSELGIQLAIDDFGTGYSSLARLKYMPFNKLKIDRSFVSDLPEDQDVCSMVKAIQGLACGLSLQVVAEGIETEEQRAWLTDQGVHCLQGFLLSYPLPLASFQTLLAEGGVCPAALKRA